MRERMAGMAAEAMPARRAGRTALGFLAALMLAGLGPGCAAEEPGASGTAAAAQPQMARGARTAWEAAPVPRRLDTWRPDPPPGPRLLIGPDMPRGPRAAQDWPDRYDGTSGIQGAWRSPFVTGQDLTPVRR